MREILRDVLSQFPMVLNGCQEERRHDPGNVRIYLESANQHQDISLDPSKSSAPHGKPQVQSRTVTDRNSKRRLSVDYPVLESRQVRRATDGPATGAATNFSPSWNPEDGWTTPPIAPEGRTVSFRRKNDPMGSPEATAQSRQGRGRMHARRTPIPSGNVSAIRISNEAAEAASSRKEQQRNRN